MNITNTLILAGSAALSTMLTMEHRDASANGLGLNRVTATSVSSQPVNSLADIACIKGGGIKGCIKGRSEAPASSQALRVTNEQMPVLADKMLSDWGCIKGSGIKGCIKGRSEAPVSSQALRVTAEHTATEAELQLADAACFKSGCHTGTKGDLLKTASL